MQHVFVYGTLRAGEVNDIRRAAECHGIAAPQWLGAAFVVGRLFDFGAYPGLVIDAGGAPVRGDIYRIDEALIPVLDEIEEVYPGVEGLFRSHRIHVEADLGDGKTHVDCLVYPVTALAADGFPLIDGGDWVAHRAACT